MATTRAAPAAGAGPLLRHWRTVRHLSQLDLALAAGISARHLSYVETGRSHPSREMVLRLSEALEIPLRERNPLLVAAGFAPRYYETGFASPELAQMRQAVELILQHQEPFPAIVMDRHWEVQLGNQAAPRFTTFLLGAPSSETNIIRMCLHPDLLRKVTLNWEEVAEDLLRHLHGQVMALPSDDRTRALLDEVLGYPGIAAVWERRATDVPPTPLLTSIFRKGDIELRYFSTFTTFGTPHDVTLEELRIECAFPADSVTARRSRELFGSDGPT